MNQNQNPEQFPNRETYLEEILRRNELTIGGLATGNLDPFVMDPIYDLVLPEGAVPLAVLTPLDEGGVDNGYISRVANDKRVIGMMKALSQYLPKQKFSPIQTATGMAMEFKLEGEKMYLVHAQYPNYFSDVDKRIDVANVLYVTKRKPEVDTRGLIDAEQAPEQVTKHSSGVHIGETATGSVVELPRQGKSQTQD